MLKWMRRNWKPLALLGGGLAAMAVLVIAILVSRQDLGFMTLDNDGKRLPCGHVQWDRSAFPLPVYIDRTSDDWRKEVSNAIVFWNLGAGFELFKAAGSHDPLKDQPPGSVLVEAIADGSLETHGLTSWKATDGPGYCRALSMHIKLPGLLTSKDTRRKATAHELGHALGLAHDDYEESVMHPGGRVIRWGLNKITENDRALLLRTYKPQ